MSAKKKKIRIARKQPFKPQEISEEEWRLQGLKEGWINTPPAKAIVRRYSQENDHLDRYTDFLEDLRIARVKLVRVFQHLLAMNTRFWTQDHEPIFDNDQMAAIDLLLGAVEYYSKGAKQERDRLKELASQEIGERYDTDPAFRDYVNKYLKTCEEEQRKQEVA